VGSNPTPGEFCDAPSRGIAKLFEVREAHYPFWLSELALSLSKGIPPPENFGVPPLWGMPKFFEVSEADYPN